MTARSNKRRRSEDPPTTNHDCPASAQPTSSRQSRPDSNSGASKRRNRQEMKEEEAACGAGAVTSVATKLAEAEKQNQNQKLPVGDGQGETMHVDDDASPSSELTCPVCYEPFVDPINAPCGHTFCRIDIEQLFRIRRPEDVSRSFLCSRHSSGERVRPCPMCRQPFTIASIVPNEELETQVKTKHPRLYEERRKEVDAAYERLAQYETHNLWLVVGNSHTDLGNTRYETARGRSSRMQHRHEWEFYVRLVGSNSSRTVAREEEEEEEEEERDVVEVDRFIESVTIQLHPTFSPSTVTLTESPFQVRRVGWGTFGISAEIKFKPQWHRSPLSVFWMLQFDQDDSRIAVLMEFETSPSDSGETRTTEEGATVLINPGEIGGWRSVLMGLLISPHSWSESDDEEWRPPRGASG